MRDVFDIRNVIGALMGIFGVILLGVGVAGGESINLWTGVALLVVCAFFAGWAYLRPVQPAERPTTDASSD